MNVFGIMNLLKISFIRVYLLWVRKWFELGTLLMFTLNDEAKFVWKLHHRLLVASFSLVYNQSVSNAYSSLVSKDGELLAKVELR